MPHVVAGTIGLLLFNAGVSLAVVNLVTLTIVPALVRLGIGLALSAATTALTKRKSPAVKPSDGQQEIRQEVPPRRKFYGTNRVSGPIWFSETNPAEPARLHLGYLINHGRIGAITEYLIDDNLVTINGSGLVQTAPYNAGTDPVHILTRLGLATETAYSEISSRFSLSECRGDGTATALFTVDNFANAETQLEVYPGGLPKLRLTITGSVVCDIRDPAQDPDDETTWVASDNVIVCLFTYCFLDPDGYGIPYSWVEENLPRWIAAMDACDELVEKADASFEKRYRLAMGFDLTETPKDVSARMLAACDGKLWLNKAGQVDISVGVFTEPTIVLDERHIIGVTNFQYGHDRLDKIAGVRANYMSPDHDYLEQEADPWPDGSTIAGLGEDRVNALDLTMVPSHSQARRLMKRDMVRANGGWHGGVICNLAGIRARDERFIQLRIAKLGIDETFEVGDYVEDMNDMRVTLEVNAVPASIDEWSPGDEEGTSPVLAPTLRETEIDRTTGTNIGDLINLAGAFDGDTSQLQTQGAYSTVASGYIGKTLASPTAIRRARCYPITGGTEAENGFSDSAVSDTDVTLRLRGKQGTAPASRTDGTLLATLSFSDENDTTVRDLVSSDLVTIWDHVWVEIIVGGGDVQVAEIKFYAWN